MRFLAICALIALVEIATFFWVQSWIGLGWAVGLAVTTAVIGSILILRTGISVWNRFRGRVNEGGSPTRELSDGATVLVSGVLLISPGFIADIIGFLLLLPPMRDLVYRLVSRRFSSRVAVFSSGETRRRVLPNEDGEGVIDVEGYEVD